MVAVVVLDDFLVRSDDATWQRLLGKLREQPPQYVDAYDGREVKPAPLRRRRRRSRKIGGYVSREAAHADQLRLWRLYVASVDNPTEEGFRTTVPQSRTQLWRIYRFWGLLFPPDKGLDPEWQPHVEPGWEPPS